jgi:hypothetical protein
MRRSRRLIGSARRIIFAVSLMVALAATVNAYTVVMRGGKRVEIPAQFTVTNRTLTYEVAPGFLITLQMAAIDIPATERANNEAPGTLLGRAREKEPAPAAESSGVVPGPKAARSITNRQLESFARARQESDRAYEQRRKELGLPPLEVARAKAAAEADLFWQELQRKRAEESRASELRAQVAALNSQLNYVQARMDQNSTALSSPFSGFSGVPYFNAFGGYSRVNRALFRVPFGVQIGGAFGSSGVQLAEPFGRRYNVFVSPGGRPPQGRGGFGRGQHGRPR